LSWKVWNWHSKAVWEDYREISMCLANHFGFIAHMLQFFEREITPIICREGIPKGEVIVQLRVNITSFDWWILSWHNSDPCLMHYSLLSKLGIFKNKHTLYQSHHHWRHGKVFSQGKL